jgi:hypothetical protein
MVIERNDEGRLQLKGGVSMFMENSPMCYYELAGLLALMLRGDRKENKNDNE